jgi:GntR family transcriptional regulator, N-acetylglucosamine utilization regulator
MAEIDLRSPLPKYYQLKEIIRDLIEKEGVGAGRAIPPERELCDRYGVSRMTARQAVMELVNEGLLYRVQGLGTFVAEAKVRQEAGRLTSFTQDMRERGMRVSSEVLEMGMEEAGPVAAKKLGIEAGEKIVRIRRVRNADGKPMALETSHLLYEEARGVLEADLSERSLYEELGRAGVRIAEADQSYEAVLVNEAEGDHLGVPVGNPALLMERVAYDVEGHPFEYVKSVYRGDRYRVAARLRA